MIRLVFALAIAFGLLLHTSTVRAGGGYFVSYSYAYPSYWGWGGWYRPFWIYSVPPPYYYYPPPPPVYYLPPRESYCVRDRVYRYLADGQIQWGTRTRCY